jgi:hypothetical protein
LRAYPSATSATSPGSPRRSTVFCRITFMG